MVLKSLTVLLVAFIIATAGELQKPLVRIRPGIQIEGIKYLGSSENYGANIDHFLGRFNLEGVITHKKFLSRFLIRAYPPGFGTVPQPVSSYIRSDSSLEKFQIEEAYFTFFTSLGDVRLGRFATNLSKGILFGNYLDNFAGSDFTGRQTVHNGIEFTKNIGISKTSIMLIAGEDFINRGMLRVYESIVLKETVHLGIGWRGNVFDRVQYPDAGMQSHFLAQASFLVREGFRPFIEFGLIDTNRIDTLDENPQLPLLIGTTIPTAKAFDTFLIELEFAANRKIQGQDKPVLWSIYFGKKLGDFVTVDGAFFSDPHGAEATDFGIGLRLTANID